MIVVIVGFALFVRVGERSTTGADGRRRDQPLPGTGTDLGGKINEQNGASRDNIHGANIIVAQENFGRINTDNKARYEEDGSPEHNMPRIEDDDLDTREVHNGNINDQHHATVKADQLENTNLSVEAIEEELGKNLFDSHRKEDIIAATQKIEEGHTNTEKKRAKYYDYKIGEGNFEKQDDENEGADEREGHGQSNWDDDGNQESNVAPKPNVIDVENQEGLDVESRNDSTRVSTPSHEKGVDLPQMADNQEGIMDDGFVDPELHTDVEDDEKTEASPPVMVIVLAQWRFGSSVIGEIFNQNPRVFFLYEPLWVVEQMVRMWRIPGPFTRETYYYSTKLLHDIFQCKFNDKFTDFVNITNHWGGRLRNNAICRESKDTCSIPDAEWLREVCLKSEGHLVTKVIRGDLGMIKPLVVNEDVNVKVIHLVRDPRGSMASRINYLYHIEQNELAHPKYAKSGRLKLLNLLTFEHRHRESVEGMCQWLRENVFPPSQVPDWLKDRYHLLRYEDFAGDPTRVTSELYDFARLRLPVIVEEWVAKNTQASRSAEGTFDVQKNSSTLARQWMMDLSETEIGQVEAQCMDVMKTLGYLPYQTLQHQNVRTLKFT